MKFHRLFFACTDEEFLQMLPGHRILGHGIIVRQNLLFLFQKFRKGIVQKQMVRLFKILFRQLCKGIQIPDGAG